MKNYTIPAIIIVSAIAVVLVITLTPSASPSGPSPPEGACDDTCATSGDGVCTGECGECGYAAAAATTPVRRAQVLRLGSRHRTLMRYRSSNLAEPKARMRLFAARKVQRLLLAFASAFTGR